MGWVQGGHAKSSHAGSAGSVAVTLNNPVTAGSCVLIGIFGGSLASMGSLTLTDDKGNSYNLSDQYDDNAVYFFSFTSYYLSNITNGPSTFTFTWGSSATAVPVISVDEYAGVSIAVDPRDGHAINHQNTVSNAADAITSGNITTTSHRDVIWGATVNYNNNNAAFVYAGTGFAGRTLETVGYLYGVEDKIQPVAGSVAATFSNDASTDGWATAVIALKPKLFGPVQGKSGHGSSGSPFITLDSPVGGGNCLVVAVYTQALKNSISVSLTDDKGNVYHISDQVDDGTFDDNCLTVFYLSNITNAPTALIARVGGGTGALDGCADEFTGVSKALDPRDGHSSHAANSTGLTDGITSGNLTTTVDGCIIYCATLDAEELSPNNTAGTGFTHLQDDIYDGVQTEYLIQSTAGTIAGTWSFPPYTPLNLTIALALKPAIGKMKQQKAYTQNVIKDQ